MNLLLCASLSLSAPPRRQEHVCSPQRPDRRRDCGCRLKTAKHVSVDGADSL